MGCESCESLMKMFKGRSAIELIQSTEIIKKIIIGISYLDNNNPNSILQKIFGNIYSHASLFFLIGKKNNKTGIIVQYGKYKNNNKKSSKILDANANKIGYVYNDGGLIYGEMEYNDYIKEFCTICNINLDYNHNSITLKKFIEEVKNKGVWNLNSYISHRLGITPSHNCQDFVAAGISVLKPKYNPQFINIRDNTNFDDDDVEKGIPDPIIKQLNNYKINI